MRRTVFAGDDPVNLYGGRLYCNQELGKASLGAGGLIDAAYLQVSRHILSLTWMLLEIGLRTVNVPRV